MSRARIPRWLKIGGIVVAVVLVAILALLIGLGWYVKNQMLDSGGKLPPAMAAYDVRHYDLAVRVFPAERRIEGRNTVTVEVIDELETFVINLDDRLTVTSVEVDGVGCEFRHRKGVITAVLPSTWSGGR